MREEFQKLRITGYYGDIKKLECVNCGGQANDFHHIVPLAVGGTNKKTNIAALCTECHYAVHGKTFKGLSHGEMILLGKQKAAKRREMIANGEYVEDVKMTKLWEVEKFDDTRVVKRIFWILEKRKSFSEAFAAFNDEFKNSEKFEVLRTFFFIMKNNIKKGVIEVGSGNIVKVLTRIENGCCSQSVLFNELLDNKIVVNVEKYLVGEYEVGERKERWIEFSEEINIQELFKTRERFSYKKIDTMLCDFGFSLKRKQARKNGRKIWLVIVTKEFNGELWRN